MELNWRIYSKKADFFGIAKKFNIDPVVARVLRNRDLTEDDEIQAFLYGDMRITHPPELMKDMDKGVRIIMQKIREGKKIRIVSDYDVDGVTSNYILLEGLKKAGADVSFEIPHRIKDGYGINERIIREAYNDGVDTIITCDNGIAALSAIKLAKELNMTVVVTDHHEMPYKTSEETGETEYIRVPADAVIDIKQPDCNYPFKGICGAVVALKFIEYLYKIMGISFEKDKYITFAAIATVCDVMPLKDENRIYVKKGLTLIRETENVGLRALLRETELSDGREITAYHLGFIIGPCINAAGRLDKADKALSLFLSRDRDEAEKIAIELKRLNDSRKKLTEDGVFEAENYIRENGLEKLNVFIIYISGLHESLAGIVAGRIKEKYYRPVIVFTDSLEEGILKGSGRSIEGYNLHRELTACSSLIEKFGGHELAAGVSIKKENFHKFAEKINKNENISKEDLLPKLFIDAAMPMSYAYMELVEQLESLAPFGTGNERPVFAEKGVRIKSARIIGQNKNTVKFNLISGNGKLCEGIFFNAEEFINNIKLWFTEQECDKMLNGEKNDIVLDIAYRPDINEYQGRRSLQIKIEGYRKNLENEELKQ